MIMIGSHVLIDPILETFDEILRPTYYDIKDKFGNFIQRPKKEWIQIKTAPSKKDRQGIVVEVGTPLRGEKCYIKKGDKILFKPNMKNLIKIEGKSYFVLRQDQILCTVEETK
jgi:co-chaperonin GroES (HSP10)